MEYAYYAENTPAKLPKDICCYCAGQKAEKDPDMLKKYRVVLPICTECKSAGKPIMKRNPIPSK